MTMHVLESQAMTLLPLLPACQYCCHWLRPPSLLCTQTWTRDSFRRARWLHLITLLIVWIQFSSPRTLTILVILFSLVLAPALACESLALTRVYYWHICGQEGSYVLDRASRPLCASEHCFHSSLQRRQMLGRAATGNIVKFCGRWYRSVCSTTLFCLWKRQKTGHNNQPMRLCGFNAYI